MSDPKNDGGQAFPPHLHPAGHPDCPQGMTLRDYFAAKAMVAYLTSEKLVIAPEEVAAISFTYADAMLAERAKS